MRKASAQLTTAPCLSASVICFVLVLQGCSPKPKSGETTQPSSAPPKSNPSHFAPRKRPNPRPSAVPASTDQDELETSLKRLRAGNLAYSTPDKMKTGQTRQVTARIAAASVPASELTNGLPGDQKNVVTLLKISTKMKMTLSGPDFTITPLSPVEQFVDNESPTQWQWDVKPNKAGKLHLRLAAIVELKELSKEFETIDREIAVQVDPVDEVSGFWKGNWQWIIATLTALGGAIWRWLARRKSSLPAPSKS
jgi:hypothetical protein